VVVVVVEELFLFNDTIGDPGRLRLVYRLFITNVKGTFFGMSES